MCTVSPKRSVVGESDQVAATVRPGGSDPAPEGWLLPVRAITTTTAISATITAPAASRGSQPFSRTLTTSPANECVSRTTS